MNDESRLEILLHRSWHEAGVPFTEVLAFGRRTTWPGRSADVSALLRKAGFHVEEQQGHHGEILVITAPERAAPDNPAAASTPADRLDDEQITLVGGRLVPVDAGRGAWSGVVRGTFKSARDVHDKIV
jgi:hypothetical protein